MIDELPRMLSGIGVARTSAPVEDQLPMMGIVSRSQGGLVEADWHISRTALELAAGRCSGEAGTGAVVVPVVEQSWLVEQRSGLHSGCGRGNPGHLLEEPAWLGQWASC